MQKNILFLFIIIFNTSLFSLDTAKIEELVFQYTNLERRKNRLVLFTYNKDLEKIARIHSEYMAENSRLSHHDTSGNGPDYRMKKFIPGLIGGIGENIAYHYGNTEEEVAKNLVSSWMKSKGHRENILHKDFYQIGIGVYNKGKYYFATQNLGDLFAQLKQEIPVNIKNNSVKKMTFQYLAPHNKKSLTIMMQFPDKKAKFQLEDGTYYIGNGVYEPDWQNGSFTITLKFQYGKGKYSLKMGKNGTYYSNGLDFIVN